MKRLRLLFSSVLLVAVSFSAFAFSSISWQYLSDLPTPKTVPGVTKQIGVAQVVYGNIGNFVLVGGGANFPNKTVLEGGGAAKVRYADLYLYEESFRGLELVKQTKLPVELEGATSVQADGGLYIIGGAMNNGISSDILFITLNKDEDDVVIEKVGTLPFTYQMGVARLYNGSIYIATGNQNGPASGKLWKFDVKTKTTTELASLPVGAERNQPVGEILNDGSEDLLYVFSGATTVGTAHVDGYAYSFKSNEWVPKSKVQIGIKNVKEISLLGARSVKINKNEMMVLGGFNKDVWADANAKMAATGLQGDALQAFRKEYFERDPQDFGWNEEILIYNTITDSWRTIGKVPFLANCGQGLVVVGNNIYNISGEIKPGVRTPKIFVGKAVK